MDAIDELTGLPLRPKPADHPARLARYRAEQLEARAGEFCERLYVINDPLTVGWRWTVWQHLAEDRYIIVHHGAQKRVWNFHIPEVLTSRQWDRHVLGVVKHLGPEVHPT